MAEAGSSRRSQFMAAVATSVPQPVGAAIAYAAVKSIQGLLPISFAFAAGALLAVVATDLLPRALRPLGWRGALGALARAGATFGISVALSV